MPKVEVDDVLEAAKTAFDMVSVYNDDLSRYDSFAFKTDFMNEFRYRLRKLEEEERNNAQN